MAANINETNGRYSLYSLKQVAWHGLGQVVQKAASMKEVIEMSGLNYNVVKTEAHAHFPNGNSRPIPGTFATYRGDTDQILGTVGSDYTVVQNIKAFDFLDNVLGQGMFDIETAGALGKGETIFVTAKVPGHIKLGTSGDIVDKYIVFTTSHDGSSPVRGMLTPIRIVCSNTLNMALNNKSNSFVVKHTINAQKKIDKGLELMKLSNVYFNEMEETLNAMRKVTVPDEHVRTHACSIILNKDEMFLYHQNGNDLNTLGDKVSTYKRNRIHEMETSIFRGPGQEFHKNTGLWLFNGVTSYYGNTVTYSNKEDRFMSLTDGTAKKEAQKLFDKIAAKALSL